MTIETEKKDLEEYLEFLPTKTKNNLEIVEVSDKIPFMLRIDNVVPNYFTPLLPLSSSPDPNKEDRTLPRICVSPDLVSCILGIARLNREFLENNADNDLNKKENIYHISSLPYTYAVKPTQKLLYDVDLTNEHWLIGYNKENQKFYPKPVGSLFIVSINVTYKEHNNGKPLTYMNCFVNINSDKGVMIKPNKPVNKGYYRLNIEKDNNGRLTVGKIDRTDFSQMKKIVVSKESMEMLENIEYKRSLIEGW